VKGPGAPRVRKKSRCPPPREGRRKKGSSNRGKKRFLLHLRGKEKKRGALVEGEGGGRGRVGAAGRKRFGFESPVGRRGGERSVRWRIAFIKQSQKEKKAAATKTLSPLLRRKERVTHREEKKNPSGGRKGRLGEVGRRRGGRLN